MIASVISEITKLHIMYANLLKNVLHFYTCMRYVNSVKSYYHISRAETEVVTCSMHAFACCYSLFCIAVDDPWFLNRLSIVIIAYIDHQCFSGWCIEH